MLHSALVITVFFLLLSPKISVALWNVKSQEWKRWTSKMPHPATDSTCTNHVRLAFAFTDPLPWRAWIAQGLLPCGVALGGEWCCTWFCRITAIAGLLTCICNIQIPSNSHVCQSLQSCSKIFRKMRLQFCTCSRVMSQFFKCDAGPPTIYAFQHLKTNGHTANVSMFSWPYLQHL